MRFCENCGSLMEAVPGGHLCSKCGNSILLYIDRYQSYRRKETYHVIHNAIQTFEDEMRRILDDPNCMSFEELMRMRLLKKKHYIYAILLAAMSSLPILSKTCSLSKITKAVIAKTALIIAIKILDNLNDKWHSPDDAAESIQTQSTAFTDRTFSLPIVSNDVGRAENSTYLLAELTKHIVTDEIGYEGDIFNIYKDDFERYSQGQIDSIRQKKIRFKDEELNIKTFLLKVNEKAVGSIWVNVDICFLNGSRHLTKPDVDALYKIKRGIDQIYKGCNIYDDVADFEEDLKEGISNSVLFLAEDMGLYGESDQKSVPQIMEEFRSQKIFELAIRLGDLMFLKGLQSIKKVKYNSLKIDCQALIYSSYILRIFAMRKWLIRNNDLTQLIKVTRIKIPSSLLKYAVYIR